MLKMVNLTSGISEVAQLCPTLCDPMDCSLPGYSIHGFSRQEYWSGLPFPPPGDLPAPGTEPRSPALKADSLLSRGTREATSGILYHNWKKKKN